MVVDAEHNKVAVHCSSTADTDLGPYANEYMFTFYMTEDGTQITRFEEFVDSDKSKKQVEPLLRYLHGKIRKENL